MNEEKEERHESLHGGSRTTRKRIDKIVKGKVKSCSYVAKKSNKTGNQSPLETYILRFETETETRRRLIRVHAIVIKNLPSTVRSPACHLSSY